MDADLHEPPPEAADAASRGLDLRRRFGRGGTQVGEERARRMAARELLDMREVRIVSAWFARHGAMRRSARRRWGDEEDPSAGYVAWLLWGGDAVRAWADGLVGRRRIIAPPSEEGIDGHMAVELKRLGLL